MATTGGPWTGAGTKHSRRPELAWCSGRFGQPPAHPPEPDWELADWIRNEAGPKRKRFYDSAAWLHLRSKVLAESHGASIYELTLSPARYVPATCVHHVMRVSQHPEWALSEWAVDETGAVIRNLIPLSHFAHDLAHGRCMPGGMGRAAPLTEERW